MASSCEPSLLTLGENHTGEITTQHEEQNMASDHAEDDIGKPLARFEIVDENEQDGVTRDELARYLLESKASGFSITILELKAVHGWWSKDDETKGKASLLVFRAKMHDVDRSRGRRFKNVRIGLRFASGKPNPRIIDDPKVSSYAPAQGHDIGLIPTAVLREKKKTGEVSIDVDAKPAPVTFGLGFTAENSFQYEKHVMATISTKPGQDPPSPGRDGGINSLEWTLGENKYEKLNVNSIDFAVLIRRKGDEDFLVDFKNISATVDALYDGKMMVKDANKSVSQGWKLLRGYIFSPKKDEAAKAADPSQHENTIAAPSQVVRYRPSSEGDEVEGVDPDNLGQLVVGDAMDRQAFYHILDVWRGVKE